LAQGNAVALVMEAFVAGVGSRDHTSVVEAFMPSEQTGTGGVPDRDRLNERWPSTVASLLAGSGFFALWFWLLPSWLGLSADSARAAGWRWIAAVPSVLGFAIAIRCVWDFGWTGRGTPVPIAPPKRLVVVGFYRYVRNPMYVGFITGWVGLWFVFGWTNTGRANTVAIIVACGAVLGVELFVRLYEEPHLRSIFGADYEEYCRNVRRWVPRLRAWDKLRRNA
jgi:protein-S-isoprenylcysteine O-methyltransferase Ste14